MRQLIILPSLVLLAACGGSSGNTRPVSSGGSQAQVDPAALYCQGTGGTVIQRVSRGRRADLCRLPNGRTVRAADLLNADNDL